MKRKDLLQQQQIQQQQQQQPDIDTIAAKLALIATAVTTLGDGIATIAAALVLESTLREKATPDTDDDTDSTTIKNMQQDIDYLKREIQFLKSKLR